MDPRHKSPFGSEKEETIFLCCHDLERSPEITKFWYANGKTKTLVVTDFILENPCRTTEKHVEGCQCGLSKNEVIVDSIVIDGTAISDFVKRRDV